MTFSHGTNCADVNEDGVLSAGDVTVLVNYVFKGGPAPVCETPDPDVPHLKVTPLSLSATCFAGSTATMNLSPHLSMMSNISGSEFGVDLAENASWLGLSSVTGPTPLTVTASVSCGQIADGSTVNESILVTAKAPGTGGVSVSVQVTKASPATPVMSVSPSSLSAQCAAGSNGTINLTPDLSVTSNTTMGVLLSENEDWLGLSATSGNTPLTVTASVDCNQLSDGTSKSGKLTVDGGMSGKKDVVVNVSKISADGLCAEGAITGSCRCGIATRDSGFCCDMGNGDGGVWFKAVNYDGCPSTVGDYRYVKNSGNDSADGLTPATAWKTLEMLDDEIRAGQTGILIGGTFKEAPKSAWSCQGSPAMLAPFGVPSEIK